MPNVATPLEAVAVVVPCIDAVPAFRVAVTTVLLSLVTRLPNASRSWITGAGEKAVPAVADEGGCVWITRAEAVAGFTVKLLLAMLLRPLALAVNCLLLPAASIRKLLNVAVPFPLPVPISTLAVP